MMNKNILLCIYLTMGFLLYDLYFDIAWLFSPHNHKIVYLVMAVVRVHIVFAVISISFPGLSNLPCALCIPSKPPSFLETQIPHSFELQSKTFHVVKMLVSSVLSFFIIHFKVKVIQNFNLSNFLVSLSGGGHWGILETAKPKEKIIQNRKKIRPKPKTAYKTVKNRYNGDKWGIQSKLN